MSALSELQPYLDAYPDNIRKAKNASGYTLQELADLSGVPYNNICDTNAGRVKQPLLFYAAAMCKVLGVSLDHIVGLGEPESADQTQRIHELELENMRLAGENKRLEALNEMLDAQLANRKPVIYMLMSVCALLLVAVIGYVIFDIQLRTAGLFQSAGTSILAVFLGLVVVAAVGIIIYAARTVHKDMKK